MMMTPWRKVVDAVAIMTVKTKMHSSKLLRKWLGRAFGSFRLRFCAISTSTSNALMLEE